MFRFAAILLLLVVPALAADPVMIDTTGVSAGTTFLLTVNADGTVTIRPLAQAIKLSSLGGTPAPNPTPDPSPTPFSAEIEKQTAAAIAAGGTKTTAAALSSVYSIIASGVSDGTIPPVSALPAVKLATDTVLAAQADSAKWLAWRTSVGGALETLRQQGALSTKEQYASAFMQVSAGARKAAGFRHDPVALSKTDPKGQGILDGIDFAKLIELIKLILELLKIFGGGFAKP